MPDEVKKSEAIAGNVFMALYFGTMTILLIVTAIPIISTIIELFRGTISL